MPAVKLTNRLIENHPLPEGSGTVELRDTEQKGLLCKLTAAGARIFMLAYRAADGTKRKPRLGAFGQITLPQAREAARQMLGAVAQGKDPSAERQQTRQAPNVAALCDLYLREVAEPHAKPSYLKQQRRMVETRIKPALGSTKVAAVTRSDITALHNRLSATPYEANRVLALASVIFNHALDDAVRWGLAPEDTNPCLRVKRFRERRRERLLTDGEVSAIYAALEDSEAAGSENWSTILAVRLLFATACRASEIRGLQWEFIDSAAGEIVWPDSKTGGMRKPLTAEIRRLLEDAKVRRVVGCAFVCPAVLDPAAPLPMATLEKAWRRILDRAGTPRCGLHAIRHRAATDIANSGAPLQVGMRLTGHKTASTYLRYLHAEREQTLAAAELVSNVRATRVSARPKAVLIPLKGA
jgi:integrase